MYSGVVTSAFLKKNSQSPMLDYFPKDGTLASNDWLGLVPVKEKPYLIDPPKGYIFHANNKFVGDGYLYESASNYITSARASRIREMIEEFISKGEKIGVEEMMEMQKDTVDVYARDMMPKVVRIAEALKGKFNK